MRTLIYSRISRADQHAVADGGYRLRSAADLGVAAKRTGWCHPSRVGISLLRLPWVTRGATHGYSNGIPPGCSSVTEKPGRPDSGYDFVLHDAGGEWVMRLNCPEIRVVGDSREGGVKAVPMHRDRSPSPGGITSCLANDEHLGSSCRGENVANGGLGRMREALESRRDCPGKATPCTLSAVGTGAKNGTFLSSLPGLVSLRSGQPTVGNGGLLSVVPMGLQRRGHSRAFPRRASRWGLTAPARDGEDAVPQARGTCLPARCVCGT